MTKSIRKGQKKLRRRAKQQSPWAQSTSYWPKKMKQNDKVNLDMKEVKIGH